MTVLEAPAPPSPVFATPAPLTAPKRPGRSLSTMQRIVVTLATLPLIGIVGASIAGLAGLISTEQLIEISLALGEEPGMAVFAAMLWCSPVQWLVKRTQVRVRKTLGILFAGYAISNFVMFVLERGIGASLSAPFLVAGTAAMVMAIPLLLTSGRWAQRKMGMRRWRSLHKLTYLIAPALVLHVALIGEATPSTLLIIAALVARVERVQQTIEQFGRRRRAATI